MTVRPPRIGPPMGQKDREPTVGWYPWIATRPQLPAVAVRRPQEMRPGPQERRETRDDSDHCRMHQNPSRSTILSSLQPPTLGRYCPVDLRIVRRRARESVLEIVVSARNILNSLFFSSDNGASSLARKTLTWRVKYVGLDRGTTVVACEINKLNSAGVFARFDPNRCTPTNLSMVKREGRLGGMRAQRRRASSFPNRRGAGELRSGPVRPLRGFRASP